MSDLLAGKVALVTGGGSGIGKATAIVMAREGAHVAVADVDSKAATATAETILAAGGDALPLSADVRREDQIAEMIRRVVSTHGRLDCAFNNAGIFHSSVGASGFLHELTADWYDRVMDVNLRGVFLCMKYELEQMVQQGNGAIVNTSSIAGLRALGGSAIYTTSKHGVVGLTKVAAVEYAQLGIRVNAVCPGWIKTGKFDEPETIPQPWVDQMVKAAPSARRGLPEEVGEAVAWLCSDRASFVTGESLPVDGGFAAGPSLAVFTGGARENFGRKPEKARRDS